MPFSFSFLTVLITVSHFVFYYYLRRKWSIVLRTKLSVRVHACIGKKNHKIIYFFEFNKMFYL